MRPSDVRGATATRQVAFLDLTALHAPLHDELTAAFDAAVRQSGFVGGDPVKRFEAAWASYCGSAHAVGVGNGTDALELVLRALGIGHGDEVIVPANSFVATAEAVVNIGAIPMFVDVQSDTLLMDAASVSTSLTSRTRAVIVVHLYGQVADMDVLTSVCRRAGIPIVEDAAQAHGADRGGRRAGTFGIAGCFSFYPGKNLGALGDAGAVVTDDSELAATVRALADHGRAAHHEHPLSGRNSRMDAIQAAALSIKLPHLDDWNAHRRCVHEWYREALGDVGIVGPEIDPRGRSAHHLEIVLVQRRDELSRLLREDGIQTGVHYPVPIHEQAPFRSFPRGEHPVVSRSSPLLLSLPMHPTLERCDVDHVVDRLTHHLRARAS